MQKFRPTLAPEEAAHRPAVKQPINAANAACGHDGMLARALGNRAFAATIAHGPAGLVPLSGVVHPALKALLGRPPVGSVGSGTLQRQNGDPVPSANPAPPDAATADPLGAQVVGWGVRIRKGGEGADQVRAMDATHSEVFKGDRATVTLEFDRPAENNHGGLMTILNGDGATLGEPVWKTDRKVAWELAFTAVGKVTAEFRAGTPRHTSTERFTVVAELADFMAACLVAITRLNQRFSGAIAKVNQAARAFRQAKEEQEADLKDVAASEKMVDDLLYGALFAAAGGFAGGAVGGLLKKAKDGAFAKNDALIDTVKDTAKFAVRSMDKLRGSTTPTTAGDSTAPGNDDPTAKRGGSRSSAGENPLDFLTTFSEKIAGEESKANGQLADLVDAARKAHDANSKASFEDDPLSIVNGGVDLASIEGIETNKAKYLKALWKTWLGTYAWRVERSFRSGYSSAEDQVSGKIREKIEKAAKALNENPDDWIREFGLPAKEKAQEEAASRNKNWRPPHYH